MSLEQRRTKLVLSVIEKLVEAGHAEFRPGDIVSHLREQNQPLGTWEVRGELSNLEAEGVLEADAATGAWRVAPQRSRKAG
ncbi:MAG: hypothetical protein ACNA7W_16350 [Pseudomonadales bacterium]